MGKMIYADQTLHGYANGHQLLAASCNLDMGDKKKMDELSDSSGIEDEKLFVNYYTGYPIANGEKYVIAKTWYAYEIKRPGCVWTHSIILATADINIHMDLNHLLSAFKRPGEEEEWDYSCQIPLEMGVGEECHDYQRQTLDYIVYTLFSSDRPKYVVVQAEEYVKEFFMVLNAMPCGVLKSFTFCTMSYADRKYEDMPFQYQMIAENNKFLFMSRCRNICICEDIHKIEKYPYWIRHYTDALLDCNLEKLSNYIAQYSNEKISLVIYNYLIRIFFAMNGRRMSLEEYFNAIELVMPELKMEFWQQTVDLVLEGCFYENYFEKHEYEILEMIDMEKFKLSIGHREKLADRIISNSPQKLYPYMKKYIHGQLKENGRKEIEYIIRNLTAENMEAVSRMEENICMVLVRINGNLILSEYIWKQPKDFQRTLIHSCSKQLSAEILRELLTLVIQYDLEDIVPDLYHVFGSKILEQLYDALDGGMELGEEEFGIWIPVLLEEPQLLVNNIKKIPSKKQRLELFLHMDLNSENILNMANRYIWEEIYRDVYMGECDEEIKTQLAVKFLMIIFPSNEKYSDKFVSDIVSMVYQKLKKNTLPKDVWWRIEYLFPEVEDCYSWDKCLRVRRAMEQKGYSGDLCQRMN